MHCIIECFILVNIDLNCKTKCCLLVQVNPSSREPELQQRRRSPDRQLERPDDRGHGAMQRSHFGRRVNNAAKVS